MSKYVGYDIFDKHCGIYYVCDVYIVCMYGICMW